MAKKSTADVYVDDDEGSQNQEPRVQRHWMTMKEKLLTECWVAVSENKEIGSDRPDKSFWWQATKEENDVDLLERVMQASRDELDKGTKKYNLKHAENDVDLLERVMQASRDELDKGTKKYNLKHAWRVLRKRAK
nr:hypothetical protein [Tanacetum cinerariifolium]